MTVKRKNGFKNTIMCSIIAFSFLLLLGNGILPEKWKDLSVDEMEEMIWGGDGGSKNLVQQGTRCNEMKLLPLGEMFNIKGGDDCGEKCDAGPYRCCVNTWCMNEMVNSWKRICYWYCRCREVSFSSSCTEEAMACGYEAWYEGQWCKGSPYFHDYIFKIACAVVA